ncbi:hypothetical protein CVT24_001909 [Panaeolus cyanescens]|uniref:Uncharacterized protein n=1 Tax=Panaeolus cyanescens TaxID=181874 RepID=A0A409YEK7_9AGAR|nr:hypothetical protein CVT24_001909 [Panaeolus cyanescens]
MGIRLVRRGGGGEGYAMIPSSLGHEYHHGQDIDADVNAFEGSGSRGFEFGGLYDYSFDLNVGRSGAAASSGGGEGGAMGEGGYGFEYGYGYRVVRASAGYGYQVVRAASGGGVNVGTNADADAEPRPEMKPDAEGCADGEWALDKTHATLSTEIGTSTDMALCMGVGIGDESQGTIMTSYAHVPLISRLRVERFSRMVGGGDVSDDVDVDVEGDGALVDVDMDVEMRRVREVEMRRPREGGHSDMNSNAAFKSDVNVELGIGQVKLVRSAAIGDMGRRTRKSGFVEGFEVGEDEEARMSLRIGGGDLRGGLAIGGGDERGGGAVQGMDTGVNVTMVEVEKGVSMAVTRQGVPTNATATTKGFPAKTVPMVQRLNARLGRGGLRGVMRLKMLMTWVRVW